MKNFIIVLASLVFYQLHAQGIVKHVATSSNTNAHITTINSRLTDGDSSAILIVTQNYGAYNDNEVGVWYSGGKWKIFNQNREKMPLGSKFNVLVLPKNSSKAFVHTTRSSNISGHVSTLNSTLTNAKPNALIYITQNYGKYNSSPVGVWYTGGKWKLYNEKTSMPMPVGTKFNVLVLNPGRDRISNLYLFAFKYSNISNGHMSIVQKGLRKTSTLFATQNWDNVYNPNITGVWYNGTKWTVYNQNRKDLPKGVRFNVLAIDVGKKSITEDCLRFKPNNVYVEPTGSKWRVTDGVSSMMIFRTKTSAKKAVDIIKSYQFDEHCFAVRPDPGLRYFKVNGNIPSVRYSGEDCVRIMNPSDLTIKKNSNTSYTVVEGSHYIFKAKSRTEATRIIKLVQHYKPKYSCYVGRPNPGMSYLRK